MDMGCGVLFLRWPTHFKKLFRRITVLFEDAIEDGVDTCRDGGTAEDHGPDQYNFYSKQEKEANQGNYTDSYDFDIFFQPLVYQPYRLPFPSLQFSLQDAEFTQAKSTALQLFTHSKLSDSSNFYSSYKYFA